MQTIHDSCQFSTLAGTLRAAVTIGNFDGCHRGHQTLLQAVRSYGMALQAATVAVTFSPRPDAFFRGVAAEALLFTEAQKARALAACGLDFQLVQPFDAALAQMAHSDFYALILRHHLRAQAIVVGDNFRFGQQRAGDTAFLSNQGRLDGIKVTIGTAEQYGGKAISSTRIRQALAQDGDVEAAAAMLGRPFMLEGLVERGDQLGRKIGVPTANLGGVGQILPKLGVYAGFVWLAASAGGSDAPPPMHRPATAVPAVFNIGVRPTVAQAQPPIRIEAHLLAGTYGPDALYGCRSGYYLTHRLRGEERFDTLAALTAQIHADISHAKQVLAYNAHAG